MYWGNAILDIPVLLRVNKCTAHGGASESEDYKFDRFLSQDFFSE